MDSLDGWHVAALGLTIHVGPKTQGCALGYHKVAASRLQIPHLVCGSYFSFAPDTSMFRFTIRDVLWLTVVVGLGCGWWADHQINSAEQEARRTEQRVLQWLAKNSYLVRLTGGRYMTRPLPPTMDRGKWIEEGKLIPNIESVLRTLLFKRDARVELPQLAEALGLLGNSDSVPVLIDCLSSETSNLRMEAAVALGLLGDKRAIEPLGHVIASDHNENVRANAVSALDRIGGADAITHIEKATNDKSSFVSEIAQEALAAYKRGARW